MLSSELGSRDMMLKKTDTVFAIVEPKAVARTAAQFPHLALL